MPANLFAERAGDKRRRNHSGIDEDVINLERVSAAIIAGCVERADLAREISFETTDAHEQAEQREQEGKIERHQEMPNRHERSADGNSARPTEPAVGNHSADDRCEINQSGVETEDRRRERLNVERMSINDLQHMTK